MSSETRISSSACTGGGRRGPWSKTSLGRANLALEVYAVELGRLRLRLDRVGEGRGEVSGGSTKGTAVLIAERLGDGLRTRRGDDGTGRNAAAAANAARRGGDARVGDGGHSGEFGGSPGID